MLALANVRGHRHRLQRQHRQLQRWQLACCH
jgi:hypothetical protein